MQELYPESKFIDKGAQGSVFLVKKDDREIAVKHVKTNEETLPETLREVEFLKSFSNPCHPALACYYGYTMKNRDFYIEMEYVNGPNIHDFLQQHVEDARFTSHCLALLKDVCSGLAYLHFKNIIHKDIKPANIIISGIRQYTEYLDMKDLRGKDRKVVAMHLENARPKIIDVGLACFANSKCPGNAVFQKNAEGGFIEEEAYLDFLAEKKIPLKCCQGTGGTPMYMAPETWIYTTSYFVSDMFSLGATFYNSITNKFLYPYAKNPKDVTHAINYTAYPRLETSSELLNSLINNFLQRDIYKRLSPDIVMVLINKKAPISYMTLSEMALASKK